MPLKASLVAVLAAASSVHAVVVARAGMPVMCAEQAKQKWLAKNAGKLGFGFAMPPEVAPKNGVAAPAAPTGPDVSSAAEDLNIVLAGQTARSETLECSATPNTLELDSRLEDMRQERAKLSRSIAAAEAEKAKIRQAMAAMTQQIKEIDVSIAPAIASYEEFDSTIKSTEQGYAKLKRNTAILLESFNQQSDELAKQQSAAPPAAQGRLEGQSKSRQLRASREQPEEEKQPPTKAITSAQRFSNKYQGYDGVGRS